jgi:hypothetical protein
MYKYDCPTHYTYPLLNADGSYINDAAYPGVPSYEHHLAIARANAAEQARRSAATAAYNAYAAEAAAGRAQVAVMQAARAAAAARLAMLQPHVITAQVRPSHGCS